MPLSQTSIEKRRWVEYDLITAVNESDDTIKFKISVTDSEYIDLKSSFIQVKGEIVNADEEPLAATADVALAKFWLHALFRKTDRVMKDSLFTNFDNTYPSKAFA